MSKFAVYHVYEYRMEGECGTFRNEDLICVFDTENEAKEFKAKYEKPHKYEYNRYGNLEKSDCGKIEIKELPTSYYIEEFWWLFK